MKIYKSLEEFNTLDNAVVTIGTFDGVHIGHQKILRKLVDTAKNTNGESVLLTFFPHPRLIINPDDENLRLINDIEEKKHQLSLLGLDHLIITPFTRDFSNLSPEDYIRTVLVNKLGTKTIIIGYDHHFGKDRQGSIKELKYFSEIFDFQVEEIAKQDINDVAVSSTRIREALIKGDIETANKYLGYYFQITGTVEKGDQIGRQIGFPTANIRVNEKHKLIPAYGIYAVEVEVFPEVEKIGAGVYRDPSAIERAQGMCYIGTRPTVDGMARKIEVNLLDFSADLYDKTIRINFMKFIRHDERFDTLDELQAQIKVDEDNIRAYFKK